MNVNTLSGVFSISAGFPSLAGSYTLPDVLFVHSFNVFISPLPDFFYFKSLLFLSILSLLLFCASLLFLVAHSLIHNSSFYLLNLSSYSESCIEPAVLCYPFPQPTWTYYKINHKQTVMRIEIHRVL